SLWRIASLHSGAREFLRSARGRSADPEYRAAEWRFALRLGPDVPGVFRHSNDWISAAVFDAADALFWQMGTGRHRPGQPGSAFHAGEENRRARHHRRARTAAVRGRDAVVCGLDAVQHGSDRRSVDAHLL